MEVQAEVGSRVLKGELLARGDDRQLQAQGAQQAALVRQARAELAAAPGSAGAPRP
ncbi:MAG: hypothetical protein U1E77_19720 [Inhella sp.]